MTAAQVMGAVHEGNYVIKMCGDVRLTLCITIEDYLEKMFSDKNFRSVLVDLTEVEGIDSTSLGLLAKLALRSYQVWGDYPVLFSPNASITRLLHSMGFDSIFIIHEEETPEVADLEALEEHRGDEQTIRSRVIAAHRTLMGLNENNKKAFASLVSTLENS